LKGSCSNFGAERMRRVCELLEQAAHDGVLEEAPKLIEQIENEFELVRIALEHERPVFAT